MKLNLTNEENILLLKLIKKIKIFPSKDTKLFCEQIKNISLELPENIKNEFINFKKNGSKNGVLFLNISK